MPRPRWLDLRLVLGVVLVLASVLLGARVLAAADDSVTVWATTQPLGAGEQVSADSLAPREVRLSEGIEGYLPGDRPVPAGTVALRSVGAGEVLPRAAVGAADAAETRYVTVAVPRDELPYQLAGGSQVEVWAAPSGTEVGASASAAGSTRSAKGIGTAPERLLGATTVQSVVREDSAFGGGGGGAGQGSTVPVVLAVQAAGSGGDLDALVSAVLQASRSGQLYLVGLAPVR